MSRTDFSTRPEVLDRLAAFVREQATVRPFAFHRCQKKFLHFQRHRDFAARAVFVAPGSNRMVRPHRSTCRTRKPSRSPRLQPLPPLAAVR